MSNHGQRQKVNRLDRMKMKANKAIDIIEAVANHHIRKWKRRFILAVFLLLLVFTSFVLVWRLV
jgi:hypothetical protein